MPKGKEFVLSNENGWVKPESNRLFPPAEVRKNNLVQNEYVLAAKAKENRTLLLLFGYTYASSPGSLDVLEISDDYQIRVALHRDEFALKELRDIDGDGIVEIVGLPCFSETWGQGLTTYDPFNVYKLGVSPADAATLSLPLSKTYNLKNYYGWAGPNCSEDFAVLLHPPNGGKPIVVPAKEAQKITGKPPKQ